MQGNAQMLFQYMEGSSKRFIIPVYQRNYDWMIEHCKQLYDDLVKITKTEASTHFFGSIVSAQDKQSGMQEYLIIDGQQRLTTVSLMLLALHNLLKEGKIVAEKGILQQKILEEFLIDKYEPSETRMKLKPIKDDSSAYWNLLEEEEDYVRTSNITVNYNYFYNRIQNEEITADQLYDAFCRLQIINIFLNEDDNPQLIFESLNSTGLDLSEGDKIRNYILMGIKPVKKQEEYYEKYWHKIEKCTDYDVSSFIRDYLSIKLQSTPIIKKVYASFKEFMESSIFHDKDELLDDLLEYARRYEKLIKANTNLTELNLIIRRLNRFGATVTRPFLMEVLRLSENRGNYNALDSKSLIEIFNIIESYLFRRLICDIPTNSLNKIFLTLNNEVIKYDGTSENYLEKFKYALLRKTSRGIFPRDEIFAEALSEKQVYLMNSKNKQYIMERFENYGTIETKDIIKLLENGTYSIEHIMPQAIQNDWKEMLGPDYRTIHETWLHRLANLTLTAYNSKYSNSTFLKKRDMTNGFMESGLRMNQRITYFNKWTEEELEKRNEQLLQQALNIWSMIESNYEPPAKVMESLSLADDDRLKGREISRYSFRGAEKTVASWVDMYVDVLSQLHTENPMILVKLADDQSGSDLPLYVENDREDDSSYVEVEPGIYLYKANSTEAKISLLRKFFALYNIDEEELIFYLRDTSNGEQDNQFSEPRHKKRWDFWTYSLPIIKEKTSYFEQSNPSISNCLGITLSRSCIYLHLIGNFTELRVELFFGRPSSKENEAIFEYLYSRKEIIEENIEFDMDWVNNSDCNSAKLSIITKKRGIENAENWAESVDFLIDGVNKMDKFILPVLEEYLNEHNII